MNSEQRSLRILFLGKSDDHYCQQAVKFCQNNFEEVIVYLGKWGEQFPDDLREWEGDYVISYLSRWVIPEYLLEKANKAAINFHPASPEYPGIGCNNFALYENADEYGATCHHMSATVDTGDIIDVKRFPVFPSDSVETLLSRVYEHQIILFYEIMTLILNNDDLPKSPEQWTRKPFTRSEFNKLGKINPDMSKEEIARRIRATSYGIWQPTIELNGFTFELKT